MTTKHPDKFKKMLNEREKEAVDKVEKARAALAIERERVPAFEEAVEASAGVVEDLEGKARAGDPEVTGKALMEARGDNEIAMMRLAGSQMRASRLNDWLGKCHTRKDVAEIVRDALVVHMLPAANAYATFHTGGFARDEAKPENLPALVVTQTDGAIAGNGVGEGTVRIVWHRLPLHMRITADQLRAALEAAGFSIDPRFALSDGLVLSSSDDADSAQLRLRNVADRTPLAVTALSNVDGWDDALARDLDLAHDLIGAEGCGARIVSCKEDKGIRTTVVRLTVAAKADDRKREGHDINLGWIFKDKVAELVDSVRPGAGRCVEAEVVSATHGGGAAFLEDKKVLAAEFVYKAKVA